MVLVLVSWFTESQHNNECYCYSVHGLCRAIVPLAPPSKLNLTGARCATSSVVCASMQDYI